MRGVTLLELLVVLALFGILFGVSAVALSALKPPSKSDAVRALERARMEAIQSGTPRTAHGVLFLPDGRAIGPGVDPLTGAVRAQ